MLNIVLYVAYRTGTLNIVVNLKIAFLRIVIAKKRQAGRKNVTAKSIVNIHYLLITLSPIDHHYNLVKCHKS